MEPDSLKWVGSSCGLHGPYVFYKAFKFFRDGKARILSLGDFFLVRCKPEDPICIAELQLLWEERTTKQLLSSSKLYFLPEDTPTGRTFCHGEDEVIAVSEKVIVRLEDLVKWTLGDFSGWARGKPLVLQELGTNGQRDAPPHRYRDSAHTGGLSFRDVLREKAQIGEDEEERTKVLVLSYPQYCRYRGVLARLRGRSEGPLADRVVTALGGLVSLRGDTRVLYCRETFQHPTLGHNESVCDHFAPNLKGRPRKKKLSVSQRRDSQNQEHNQNHNPNQPSQTIKESSSPEPKAKVRTDCKAVVAKPKNGGICKRVSTEKTEEREKEREKERDKERVGSKEECRAEEQAFLVALYKYMTERKTPIERLPYLGFKQINLWTMFQAAQKLGGYELITARRLWKHVYDELGGNPGSTSAATCTRRHYERLLLPYENYTKGEDDKPMPLGRPRKQELGATEGVRVEGPGPKRPKAGQSQDQRAKSEKESQNSADSHCSSLIITTAVSDESLDSQHPLLPKEESRNADEEEEEELQLTVKKEEALSDEKPLFHYLHYDDGLANQIHQDISLSPYPKHLENPTPDLLDKYRDQERDRPSGALPDGTTLSSVPHWQSDKPGYNSPCTPGALDSSMDKETQIHGGMVGLVLPTLNHTPTQLNGTVPERHTDIPDRPTKGEGSLPPQQTPPFPKVNPGVMSPLAKKKLLSQVSGTGALPNDYSFLPLPPPLPPAMVSRSWVCGGGDAEDTAEQRQGSQSASPETALLPRPSVIQHAQRFIPQWSSEERRTQAESEPFPSSVAQTHTHPQPQQSSSLNPYQRKSEPPDGVEEAGENRTAFPSQTPGYGGDVYSSPHLHSLYRHTEHHHGNEHLTRYLNGEQQGYFSRESECDRNGRNFIPNGHDSVQVGYRPPPSRGEQRGTSPGDPRLVDEPTDLSLPKMPHSKPWLCGLPRPMMHQDSRTSPLSQSCSLDMHPRACRVPPMPTSPPKHPQDPSQRLGGWREAGIPGHGGMEEETGRPILGVKCAPQSVGSARPLKRVLEEQENGALAERKIRAVSPLHPSRDPPAGTAGGARAEQPEVEMVKLPEPAHAVHLNCYTSDRHKYPLHVPLLGGLYPSGTFVAQDVCEGGLGFGLAAPHPLAFLKSQAAISPMMHSPFTLHALMMQRQLLSGHHRLYRPLLNSGGPYGDLLPHGLYPLSNLNPHPAYTHPQMPSMQPSTKL